MCTQISLLYDVSHGHPWGAQNHRESQRARNKRKSKHIYNQGYLFNKPHSVLLDVKEKENRQRDYYRVMAIIDFFFKV